MSFIDDLNLWVAKAGRSADKAIKAVCTDISSKVIQRTPVDTGRARGNWQPSIGNPITNTTDETDKSGRDTAANAENTAKEAPGNIFYLMNNLPYIGVLEYGRYPNPPKRGTLIRKSVSATTEQRSSAGFSKQAPQGMVRVTVQEFEQALAKAVSEGTK